MKKGFTLIELLAVILILGIIALIAIPTVNKIIAEARYGAFKSGNENIMKQVEQDCQTKLIKGEIPIYSYIFNEGKSSSQINAKGSFPNDGYIILNKECDVINYYLTSGKNVYKNNDDIREDNMLKSGAESQKSIFEILYSDYYSNIINIYFINNLNIPGNAIEIKDPSISEKGQIKSWLIPDGENYDLYIGSNNIIYANYNSSYLFNNFMKTKTITFDNFNTSFVTRLDKAFYKCEKLLSLDLSKFDTSNVIDINRMFENCFKIKHINVSTWNTSKVTDISWTFEQCSVLETIDLSSWNTSKVTDMSYLFSAALALKHLNLSNFDTSNVTNFEGIFRSCTNLISLNLKNWDISKATNYNSFFNNNNYALNNITISNDGILNIIQNYLPTRTIDSPGTIIFYGDKLEFDTSLLTSKNWNLT